MDRKKVVDKLLSESSEVFDFNESFMNGIGDMHSSTEPKQSCNVFADIFDDTLAPMTAVIVDPIATPIAVGIFILPATSGKIMFDLETLGISVLTSASMEVFFSILFSASCELYAAIPPKEVPSTDASEVP